jgi:hypothetical protein
MYNKTHTKNCKEAYQETVKRMKPLMSKDSNVSYPHDMLKELKFQLKGSKVGDLIFHFSTNHDTCFQKCDYCYNHSSIRRYKNTGINYDNNTRGIINRLRLPAIPKNKIAGRISLNGDFSFKNLKDSIYYIKEWHRLAIANHNVMFFGYTKSWQDKRLLPYLNAFKAEKNVVLRASVDDDTGYKIPATWSMAGIESETVIKKASKKTVFVCKFNQKDHKLYKVTCDKCKICFNKGSENVVVLFPKH